MNKNAVKIIYVTRDVERALGTGPSEDYRIVTNRTPYSEEIQRRFPDFVTLIEPQKQADGSALLSDTSGLLESPITEKIISGAKILVFKNTSIIESICQKKGWCLLNPGAELAEKIENKITQIEWLNESNGKTAAAGPAGLAQKYLPPHTVAPLKDIKWKKEPLVIQWAHGHTGDGTILVNSGKELEALQTKFPERLARATSFVNGPSFTLNIVVTRYAVHVGNVSYQITGLPPFTDNPFSTIGNDWSLTHTLLSEKEISDIENMAKEIGDKMAKDGWIGMCGIDVMRDEERDKIFLIEINARQPASTTFESLLQQENREMGVNGITIFEAYKMALLGDKIDAPIIHINDGAQIIKRVTKDGLPTASVSKDVINSLEQAGYKIIQYANFEYNLDQLRIQSKKGIMSAHAKFNPRGKEIVALIDETL